MLAGGGFWESPSATNLKGWDDSYLLLHYKNAENKSRILLLYNDGKIAESGNSRRSLGLYYLADSATKTPQNKFIFLQNIDIVDEAYPNEVSYPSAVIDKSALFVGYTYNRKAIKLQKIELAEIERKIAESTLFSGLESMGLKRDSSFCKSKKKQKLLKSSCEVGEIKDASHKSFLVSANSQNLGENISSLRDSAKQNRGNPHYENITESQYGLPRSHSLARNDEFIRDSSPTAQNDNLKGFAESGAESTINYDIFGIYLLFLAAFFFATNSLSKRAKYFALPCFVALISIPFIFVLWDYYSIVKLFYSLFGGTSVFCALLCVRYIAIRLLCNLCGSLKNPRLMDLVSYLRSYFPAQPTNLTQDTRIASANNQTARFCASQNLALTLAIFSIPLFLGHLDLISVDILRSGIFSAIFASAFIVALFWADRWAFIFALIAVIIDKDFIFALFDGYLLIFSVVYCAIWAVKWSFKKIIARA